MDKGLGPGAISPLEELEVVKGLCPLILRRSLERIPPLERGMELNSDLNSLSPDGAGKQVVGQMHLFSHCRPSCEWLWAHAWAVIWRSFQCHESTSHGHPVLGDALIFFSASFRGLNILSYPALFPYPFSCPLSRPRGCLHPKISLWCDTEHYSLQSITYCSFLHHPQEKGLYSCERISKTISWSICLPVHMFFSVPLKEV